MNDYLPLGDGFSRFVEASLIPAIVAVGLYAYLIYPSIDEWSIFSHLADSSTTETVALLGVAALVVALVVACLQPAVLNLASGHTLPDVAPARAVVNYHVRKRNRIESAIRALEPKRENYHKLSRLSQQWRDYPTEDRLVVATRLGNRLRSAESYGTSRFGLDTLTFYFELRKHAGEQVVKDLDHSRLGIDMASSWMTASMLFAIASIVGAIAADDNPGATGPVVSGVGAVLVFGTAYYLTWIAAHGYHAAMRAVTNEGRRPLAASLGLKLPSSLADERQFWLVVRGYVFWGQGTPVAWSGTAGREAAWEDARIAFENQQQPDGTSTSG